MQRKKISKWNNDYSYLIWRTKSVSSLNLHLSDIYVFKINCSLNSKLGLQIVINFYFNYCANNASQKTTGCKISKEKTEYTRLNFKVKKKIKCKKKEVSQSTEALNIIF